MINWNAVTIEDDDKIEAIVDRAVRNNRSISVMRLSMDIAAVHVSGCKLDLDALLAFPEGDFNHDVCGIENNVDRTTGALENCFLPRCSA